MFRNQLRHELNLDKLYELAFYDLEKFAYLAKQ